MTMQSRDEEYRVSVRLCAVVVSEDEAEYQIVAGQVESQLQWTQ